MRATNNIVLKACHTNMTAWSKPVQMFYYFTDLIESCVKGSVWVAIKLTSIQYELLVFDITVYILPLKEVHHAVHNLSYNFQGFTTLDVIK